MSKFLLNLLVQFPKFYQILKSIEIRKEFLLNSGLIPDSAQPWPASPSTPTGPLSLPSFWATVTKPPLGLGLRPARPAWSSSSPGRPADAAAASSHALRPPGAPPPSTPEMVGAPPRHHSSADPLLKRSPPPPSWRSTVAVRSPPSSGRFPPPRHL
jgi:hypothetical protein